VLVARGLRGQFSRDRHLAVQNVALWWHFVGGAWVAIFAALYLSAQVLR